MVWRLTFYDTGGNEVLYVEKPDRDTYDVVRVDDDPTWDDLERYVRANRRVPADQPPDRWINDAHFTVASVPIQLPPKEHLAIVDELTFYKDVGSTELVDKG